MSNRDLRTEAGTNSLPDINESTDVSRNLLSEFVWTVKNEITALTHILVFLQL